MKLLRLIIVGAGGGVAAREKGVCGVTWRHYGEPVVMKICMVCGDSRNSVLQVASFVRMVAEWGVVIGDIAA